jgi:Acetyltransferase (GNAT) domain
MTTVDQQEKQTSSLDKPSARAQRFLILDEFPPPDLERAWRECLNRIEVPSHYVSPEYFLDPLRRGTRPFAVLALENDQVRGVLTGFHLGREVISGLPSRPQICGDGTETTATLETLAQGLLSEADDAELVSVYTWASLELAPFSAHGFRRRQLPGSVVLDLTRGADTLFKEFTKDRRRNIRFAEKHGVEVREATTVRDIVDAHAVYLAWRGTERKKVHGDWSFESFEKTVRVRSNRRLFLASFSGQVIAINIFRFSPGGWFESAANSSLDQFMYLKPNDLLQWRGIQWACTQGLRRHSLGGAHEFLLRFGGTVVPILRYRLDRTLFRRHDLKENFGATARLLLRSAPSRLGQTVRRLFENKRKAH